MTAPPRQAAPTRAAGGAGVRLRRIALAVAGGLLLLAGHPPLDLAPAGWVALVPLLLLARELAGQRRWLRRSLGWGLLAGLVFFLPLLAWVRPFGVVPWLLLSFAEALSIAAFVAGMTAWGERRWRPLAAVVWWVALEAVRSSVPFGGFPWGVLGYTQHDGGPLLALARAAGVLGVSAACAAVAALLAETLQRRRWELAAGAAGVVALAALVGAVAPVPAPTGERLDIAGVQAADLESSGAAGALRRDEGRIVEVVDQMVAATAPLAGNPPDVTVWPENSVDDPENPRVQEQVENVRDLLDGAPLLINGLVAGPREDTFYNVLVEVSDDGLGQRYVKRLPTPFGEYVPLRPWLEWYPALDQLPYDVLPGDAAGVLEIAGARLGAVICYENVFAWLVHEQVRAGAQLLVVSTNNTPFSTVMSEQHLAFSQLRAVETGRWVLHASVSGISGIVDPHGVVTQRTEKHEQAIVRGDLPLVDGLTVATRVAWLVQWLAIVTAVAGLVGLAGASRRRRG